jgi:branched-chain amino acid aminotransferase
VYLDAKTDTYLEEVSSCNIFIRRDKVIKTPPLGGTILPGQQLHGGAAMTSDQRKQ